MTPPGTEQFSKEQWQAWIETETRTSLDVYERDPEMLISSYRGERRTSHGYHGREVLELLQNANDAAADAGQFARVTLELSAHGLVLSNTGTPFKPKAITSFRLPNMSTKGRDGRLIGNKGLGFRSVLNWTDTPIILSGNLEIGFGPEFAKTYEVEDIVAAAGKDFVALPTL